MNWYIVQAYSGFEKKVVESIKDELKKHKLDDNIDEILVHVNGGKDLYKRRSGFKNAIAESKLQLLLYKCKIKPLFLVIIHLFLRTFFLLLPSRIIESVYKKNFRNKF